MLEAHNKVVRVSHDDHRSSRFPLPPLLRPLVECVVKIHVRKYWAHHSSLRRPLFTPLQLPLFHHSRSEPFPDQSCDSSVSYPVLDPLLQPFVGDAVKEPSNVCIKHPVDRSLLDSYPQRVQRVVRRPPSPESIREPFELRLPDGAQYLGHHTLDDFVFQRWHPQSSLPSVCFRDVHPSHCRCSI